MKHKKRTSLLLAGIMLGCQLGGFVTTTFAATALFSVSLILSHTHTNTHTHTHTHTHMHLHSKDCSFG